MMKEQIEYKEQIRYEMPNKICLIGDAKVGKTCLIRRFEGDDFNYTYEPTEGGNYTKKKITFDFKDIELDIWEVSGDEKYRPLIKHVCKDASIIIFVYDITNKNSFENIKDFWYNEIKNYIEKETLMVILGNKEDLYEDQEVEEKEAADYAKSIDAKFKLLSARTGSYSGNFFEELINGYLYSE